MENLENTAVIPTEGWTRTICPLAFKGCEGARDNLNYFNRICSNNYYLCQLVTEKIDK
ncbi:MAG: hypothetical protein WC438_03825 [Candidatus Pacearchaeota archaeon]